MSLVPVLGLVSWVLAPVGLVISIGGLRSARDLGSGRDRSWVGVVLSVFGIVMCLAQTVFAVVTYIPS